MKTNQAFSLSCLSATLYASVAAAAPDPIVAADWFPLVNGAILEYRNDAVVSSTTGRVTVTGGQTFNNVGGLFSWKLTLPCDATVGKSDWGSEVGRVSKSNGTCIRSYERFLAQANDGLLAFGDRQEWQDYGFISNRPLFVREMTYASPLQTLLLRDAIVPGEYIRSQLPLPNGSWVLNGKSGAYWSANVSAMSTFTGITRAPVSKSAQENFREVGIYPPRTINGIQLSTLYVEDAILDTSAAFSPSQLRYQTFEYAKGIGPVIIKANDTMYSAANASNFVPNAPGGGMMETFVLTRHNLYGCPGYDASLPPLPPNSGNLCAKFYAPQVGVTKTMTEFYYAPADYYFITSRDSEKTALDGIAGWSRTGKSFNVLAANDSGSKGLTRFYFDKVAKNGSRGSHFYTLIDSEVASLNALNPGNAQLPAKPFNEAVDSYAYLPAVSGAGGYCLGSLTPVYRLFRAQAKFPDDPNHRFTTDLAVYNDFVAKGWNGEGVNFCVLPPPN